VGVAQDCPRVLLSVVEDADAVEDEDGHQDGAGPDELVTIAEISKGNTKMEK